MNKRSYFKCPNALIRDTALSYSARKVGAVLFAYSNALGACRKSYAQIARLAGCSEATAVAAVRQLAQADYITYCTTSRYCSAISRVGKARNIYSVSLATLEAGYTLVSRDVFRHTLTDAAFVIYMAVLSALGNDVEAWPSISTLQKITGAARRTVLAGLKLLKRLPTLLVQLRRKRNGAWGNNKYRPCHVTAAYQASQIKADVTGSTGNVDTGGGKAVVASLPLYHRVRQAICQGLRRIFSFFCKGGREKFSDQGYYLLNDRAYKRKEITYRLPRVYVTVEHERKNKNFYSENQRAGAAPVHRE